MEQMDCSTKGEKYKHIAIKPVKEKPEPKLKKINRPSMEHPWKKSSYDKWLLRKAHLQIQKISEELVLAEVLKGIFSFWLDK